MNTFKESIKLGLSLILTNLCCSLGCFFIALMFSGLVVKKWGGIIYTVIAVLVLFDLIYAKCWQTGNRDKRDIKIFNNHLTDGESPKSPDKFKGTKAGALYTGICILFVVLYIAGDKAGGTFKIVTNIILRFWNAPYLTLLGMDGKTNIISAAVVSCLPILYSSFGYVTGIGGKNYVEDFTYGLIYKKRSKKKGDNK